MFTIAKRAIARALLAVPGHRVCCRIPEWTAHGGPRWDTVDVTPRNLYNLIWRAWQWAERTDAEA